MKPTREKLHNTSRYPTSLIIGGGSNLGVEIARSLLEQGGYVIIIDRVNRNVSYNLQVLKEYKLLTILDFSAVDILEDELRRLDYVFYLQHKQDNIDERISTQEFLQFSNYLDVMLDLSSKFEAKFLLTTSIRAHRQLLANRHIDINYSTKVEEKHSIYTELEIQRYAESLVTEYQEKVGLDARVIRTGELIGKGIEINSNSSMTKLIINGLNGKNLLIPGDGLESELYVHHLDAAYGILKAQFSLNTKGKIYTLANEEEVTILSIAYKLLELIPEAGEIVFDQDSEALPPLVLYKPAPNLAQIGWKPRVNFDRGLAQTVEFIREELNNPQQFDEAPESSDQTAYGNKIGLSTKLRKALINKKSKSNSIEQNLNNNLEGALARLIAERKVQDRARKGSIILANDKLRDRVKSKQEKSLIHRTNKIFDNFMLSIKKRFFFLKNVSVSDFVFMIIGLIAFIIIYFILISPIFSLGKNAFVIKTNLNGLNKSMQNYDFEAGKRFNQNISTNLADAQQRLIDLKFLFDIFNKQQDYNSLQNFLTNSLEYFSGYDEVFLALEPLSSYFEEFDPQLKYTFSNFNLLTLSNEQEFSQLVASFDRNQKLIEIGIAKVQKSQSDMLDNSTALPSFLKNDAMQQLSQISDALTKFEFVSSIYQYLPDLLGNNVTTSYLIVVQDNARYTPAGGDVAGFIYLDIKEGGLINVEVKTINQLQITNANFTADNELISEINLISDRIVTKENITLEDVSLLSERDLYLRTIQNLYSSVSGKKVDAVMSINLNALSDILAEQGEINYQQLNFNDQNLLGNLSLLLGDNVSEDRRNEIIMNLMAIVVEQQINGIKDHTAQFINLMARLFANDDLYIYSTNLKISNFLSAVVNDNASGADQVSFGVNNDNQSINFDKFVLTNIVVKVEVNKDLSTVKAIEISASGAENYKNSYVCVPSGAKNFVYQEVSQDLVSTNFSLDKTCSLFLKDNDYKYLLEFDTQSFVSDPDKIDNYTFELIKQAGVEASYNIEFTFAEGLNPDPLDKGFILQGNKYIYSGLFTRNNKIFKFNIN